MNQVILFEDENNKLAMFKDNHIGMVIQLYRYTNGQDAKGEATRNTTALWTAKVSVRQEDGSIKKADSFKADVQRAIAEGNIQLGAVQKYDIIIDGVYNDYRSQAKGRKA